MISIMYIIIMLIVDISIFATYQSAAKPNRNILLSATIPYEFLKDSKIAEIVKKYKKINLVLFMAAMAVAIPIITIKYVSFVTLYLFLWIFALMFLFSYVFKKYNNQLLLLKREKNWFSGSSHIVSIDTEVSRIKSKMPVSKVWFLPSIIISIIAVIIAFNERDIKSFPNSLSLSAFIGILAFMYLYTLTCREKTRAYCEDTEINIACNYIHKRMWSICWVIIASIESTITLLQSLLGLKENINSWLYVSIMVLMVCIILLIIIAVHNKIINTQSTLLQAIKEPIYTDDDEYWKNGFYNNPSDNRTMVEKRFGYGYTVNMATWKGKIITYGSLLAIAVLLLWMFIMFIRFDFAEFELSFKGDIVQIQAPVYGYSFNVNEIEGVSIIETLPGGGKTNGVGTEQYSLGNFNLNGLGRSKMYVYKDYPPYVLIQLRDIFVIYNTKSADETLKYYELLSNKIE